MFSIGKIHSTISFLFALSVPFSPENFQAKGAEMASLSQSETIEPLLEVPFHKGVNINGWFDRHVSQVNPDKIKDSELDNLCSLGMDVVRLPVNFHSNIGSAPDYRISDSYLAYLDDVVNRITSRGLWVIIDHHSLSVETFPQDGEALITSCLKQLALRYKGRDKIVLELFNEPFGDYLQNNWPEMQGRIIKAIRSCDTERILIATPWGCYPERLSELPEYDDPRVIYTFHYYNPLMFTHQDAYWDENLKYLSGYPFPYDASRMPEIHPHWQNEPYLTYLYNNYPNDATADKIREDITKAAEWATQHGKLLFCGELGVLNSAKPADRYRWYKAVGNILAEKNIPWTLWQYNDQQLINFSIFTGAQISSQLDTEMMEAMGVNLPEGFASGQHPLTIYSDGTGSWCNIRTDKNGGDKYLDYYCTDNPAEGNECIRYNVVNPNGGVWFEMWLPVNASNLQASGANLEFMARTTDKIKSLEFYFQHYVDGAPRQWRMSATVSSDGNTLAAQQLSPDGEWHKISIPLSEMQYHGCDGEWKDQPDEGEAGFDWSRLNWLMITPSGDKTASGKTIYLDDIKITAPQKDNKIYRQLAFLCSDNIEMNGITPGWNAAKPYIIDRCDDGNFRFSVRFGNGTATWLMFTDGIESGDNNARNASARIPDLAAAFTDPLPEDLKTGNAFNSKYLMQTVGKTVPMEIKDGQGFQVSGNGQAVTYNIVMPADLSTMTIESVTYPESLYLYGDATPGGWEVQNATAMENLGNGVYRYVGELKAGAPGALQIYAENPAICGTDAQALGTENATINCWGVSNTSLNYYETGRPGNCFYQIQSEETNNYILTVDVANSTISVLLNNLYFADSNSEFKFVQMTDEGNRVFSHKGYFPAGDAFTFAATAGWTTTIAPGEGDAIFGLASYSNNTLKFGSGCTMKNTFAGYYTVSADLNNNTFTTRTYNPDPIEKLYVACNGNYNEMTAEEDGTFVWGGDLAGSFMITPQTEAYPCYIPAQEDVAVPATGITGGEMAFNITDANNISNKWTIGNAGKYTVTVNPSAMTVSVTKDNITNIDGIRNDDMNAPTLFYDLMGRKVQHPAKGIYIRQQGNKTQKAIF